MFRRVPRAPLARTHGGTGDTFWSIVKAGAVQGGRELLLDTKTLG